MKQVILLFFSITVYLNAICQPILTDSSNSPVPGDEFTLNVCDTSGVLPGMSDSGVIWDFTFLITQLSSNAAVAVCTGSPYCDSFPGSTLSISYGTSLYNYCATNLNMWAITGKYYVGFGLIYYLKPEILLRYPFTYKTSTTDTFIASFLPAQEYTTASDSVISDAYGNLSLPSNSYSNVLREHIIRHTQDSTPTSVVNTISESYQWFQPGFHYPLLELDYDISGEQKILTNVTYAQLSTTSIKEIQNNLILEVNPNPANNVIDIKFDLFSNNNTLITITDILGRIVGSIDKEKINDGINDIKYPITNFPEGIYFIQLKNENLNSTKKIVIIR